MDSLRAEFNRELIGNFPNGVLVLFDSDLRYRVVGPEVLPFSGRKATDMKGKTIHELFPETTAAELEPNLQATIEGEPQSFDIEYVEMVHHLETKPVTIDQDPYGVLVTQDVTNARNTTAELERQTERLESVASILSHDLRNPLSIAKGHLELEREEQGLSESLEAIERALDRMDRIIEDVLDLAREGRERTEFERVSIAALCKAAWEMVATGSTSLSIDTDAEVMADSSRLQRVFENLFRNAIEHGGEVETVRVGEIPDGFFVADDGGGIPEAERDHVFDFGYSTADGSTGIGLKIVEAVANHHGWEIRIDESSEGGAKFEFTKVEFPTDR